MVWPNTTQVMTTRKKQTPKTLRSAGDLDRVEPTEAIICDPITEPKRLGKDLVVENKIVDRPAGTSQVPCATALGYNTCPRMASLGRLRAEPMEAYRFVITQRMIRNR